MLLKSFVICLMTNHKLPLGRKDKRIIRSVVKKETLW
jgi:hypothetical protein